MKKIILFLFITKSQTILGGGRKTKKGDSSKTSRKKTGRGEPKNSRGETSQGSGRFENLYERERERFHEYK